MYNNQHLMEQLDILAPATRVEGICAEIGFFKQLKNRPLCRKDNVSELSSPDEEVVNDFDDEDQLVAPLYSEQESSQQFPIIEVCPISPKRTKSVVDPETSPARKRIKLDSEKPQACREIDFSTQASNQDDNEGPSPLRWLSPPKAPVEGEKLDIFSESLATRKTINLVKGIMGWFKRGIKE